MDPFERPPSLRVAVRESVARLGLGSSPTRRMLAAEPEDGEENKMADKDSQIPEIVDATDVPAPPSRLLRIAPPGHYTRFKTTRIGLEGQFAWNYLDQDTGRLQNLVALVETSEGHVLAIVGVRDEQLYLDRTEWQSKLAQLRDQFDKTLAQLAATENECRDYKDTLSRERQDRAVLVNNLRQSLLSAEARIETAACDVARIKLLCREELRRIASRKDDSPERSDARHFLGWDGEGPSDG